VSFVLEALLVFGAGVLSVLSPCVLPILPIIVTGTGQDCRYRPLLIVLGLAITFVLMGVISALFGGLIGQYMQHVEKAAGVLIILLGIAMLAGFNPFKGLGFLSNIHVHDHHGRWSGLLLGLTLGIIWIPCVGPVLSGVLAKVAGRGELGYGIVLLSLYTAGFSLPMLFVAYLSHAARKRLQFFLRHPLVIRVASGLVLIVFGAVIAFSGMLAFAF